jgi:hypothetical protein
MPEALWHDASRALHLGMLPPRPSHNRVTSRNRHSLRTLPRRGFALCSVLLDTFQITVPVEFLLARNPPASGYRDVAGALTDLPKVIKRCAANTVPIRNFVWSESSFCLAVHFRHRCLCRHGQLMTR